MRFRSVTFGRGLVLIILGAAIGTGLFLENWFSETNLRDQVVAALRHRIRAPFELSPDQVGIDLEHGLVIHNLVVPYPKSAGAPGIAIAAERIEITIDHEALLNGTIHIRQVDVHGLTLTLRRDPMKGGLPGLPGILQPPAPETGDAPVPPPQINIHPGAEGSWLVVEDDGPPEAFKNRPRILRADRPLRLQCTRAEYRPEGDLRHIVVAFESEQLGDGLLTIDQMPAQDRVLVDLRLDELRLERDDFAELSDEFRRVLPPVIAKGRADIVAHVELGMWDGEVRELTVDGTLSEMEGTVGNVWTGEDHGYPFRFRDGTATIRIRDAITEIRDLRATYVSPDDDTGKLGANFYVDWQLGASLPLYEVNVTARGVKGAEIDMRRMLQPVLVKNLVDPFRTAATFDLDICVQQLPAHPIKIIVDMRFFEATASFVGHLDEQTRRRMGFDYPLERGHGRAVFEGNLANTNGLYDEFRIYDIRGYRPLADVPPDTPGQKPTQVEVKIKGLFEFYETPVDHPATDYHVQVEIEDLPIDEELDAAFKRSGLPVPYSGLGLTGWVDRIRIDLEQDGWVDRQPYAKYTIDFRDCSMKYDDFPLPIEDISGRVVKYDRYPGEGDAAILELPVLAGRARGGGTIRGSGRIRMPANGPEERKILIASDDLPIGPEILKALRNSAAEDSSVLKLWDDLQPYGEVAARIHMGTEKTEIEILPQGKVHLRGYRGVDCPITHLNGKLTVNGTDIRIERLKGRLKNATVWLAGELRGDGDLDISSSIHNLEIDDSLRELLRSASPSAYESLQKLNLQPNSRAHVALLVRQKKGEGEPIFNATLTELDLRSEIAGVPLRIRGGPVRFEGEYIHAKDIRMNAPGTQVQIREARVRRDFGGHGWVIVDANQVDPERHIRPFLGDALADTLGPDIRADLKNLRIEFNRGDNTVLLSGAIDLRRIRPAGKEHSDRLEPTGMLGLSPLTVRFPNRGESDPIHVSGVVEYQGLNLNLPIDIKNLSGELLIAEGTFTDHFTCSGAVRRGSATIFGRQIRNSTLNVDFSRRFLRLRHLESDFYGGKLLGDVEVHFEEPGGFFVDLRLSDASLTEFLRDSGMSGDEFSGKVNAALKLRSPSSEVRRMRGRAEIRITDGHLLKIPGLRSVLGVLGRVVPFGESPRFKQAEIDMNIDGETFDIERLRLSTAVNDIYGYGTCTIYGDIDLLIFPQVTRMLDLPRIFDVPFLSAIGNVWFKNVHEIRLEGTLDSPALRRRALPMFKKKPKTFTQSPHVNFPRQVRPRVLPE